LVDFGVKCVVGRGGARAGKPELLVWAGVWEVGSGGGE